MTPPKVNGEKGEKPIPRPIKNATVFGKGAMKTV
jgi:hypothetical protein